MQIFTVTVEHITTRPAARTVIGRAQLSYDDEADCPAIIVTAPKSSLTERVVAVCHRLAESCGASIEFLETDDAGGGGLPG